MKKRSLLLSTFFMLFFTSSILAQAENLSAIELSINAKEFKKYIAKDETNKSIPLIVVTNEHFSEFLELDFEGKRIPVFSYKRETNLEESQIFIDIKKFKIRDDVAIVKFKYNGYTIKVKHKKEDGIWTYSSFSLKGNRKRYFNSGSVN